MFIYYAWAQKCNWYENLTFLMFSQGRFVCCCNDHKQLWTHMLMLWSDVISSALICDSLTLPSFTSLAFRQERFALFDFSGIRVRCWCWKAFSSPSPWRTRAHHGWQTGRVWRVWDLQSQELKTSTGTTGDEHLIDTQTITISPALRSKDQNICEWSKTVADNKLFFLLYWQT